MPFNKIAYDTTLCRPACPILQAAMGCKSTVAQHFDTRVWLTHPTKDLVVHSIKEGELIPLVEITNKRNKELFK